MAIVEVRHLTKKFGEHAAVDDVNFSVDAGEILVIVGESGCGKTTTLRCIAGLETPTEGEIVVGGMTMFGDGVFVPPERRELGMVFQSYALWPHMTVFSNIAYGLALQKKKSKQEIRADVERIIDMVDLTGLGERYPSTLSGGQQQRVALARSAVAEPRLLLLDEPLSNLDAKLREQMRSELKHMIKKLQMTAIHITHDQHEAMGIADRIICMRSGRIEQMGDGRDLYYRPRNRFIADFIGTATFIDGTVVSRGVEESTIRLAGKIDFVSDSVPADSDRVVVAIRPESVSLTTTPPEGNNVHKATVLEETFFGSHTEYVVDVGGVKLGVNSPDSFKVSADLFIRVAPERVLCLPT
jgi:ABC-type Fe3+/spermidine/putrescine transport system ATPase subunit